jgi:hypothetical protein
MLSVIGIHSAVAGLSSAQGGPAFTDGHAWLTLHYTNGRQASIGLWAEGGLFQLRHLVRDPVGVLNRSEEKFEVRFDEEIKRIYRAEANRYYGLYAGQQSRAIMALGKFTGWRATHTCATWATDKMKEIFGVALQSTEGLGLTNTPRALGHALRVLEAKEPTSIQKPKYVGHA